MPLCLFLRLAGHFLRAFGFHFLLRLLHRSEISSGEGDEKDHEDRHERIKVKGDRGKEHVEAVLLADFARNRDRPAGDRRDDADRRGRRVDNVGQLLSRDAEPVRDRPHDGSDGQAVEAVVDEDHDAKERCGKCRRPAAVQPLPCPPSVGLAAARLSHEHDDRPEQSQEDDHVGVVGDLRAHHVKCRRRRGHDRSAAGKCVDQHARKNADKQ